MVLVKAAVITAGPKEVIAAVIAGTPVTARSLAPSTHPLAAVAVRAPLDAVGPIGPAKARPGTPAHGSYPPRPSTPGAATTATDYDVFQVAPIPGRCSTKVRHSTD